MNKELSLKREIGNHECGSCNREYNSSNLIYKNNNIYWPATLPETRVCVDVSTIIKIS